MNIKIQVVLVVIAFLSSWGIQAQVKQHANNINYQIVKDSTGISVCPFYFNPRSLYPKKQWEGKWIWLNQLKYPEYQFTNSTWIENKNGNNRTYKSFFRKKFDLKNLPDKAILFASGDVSFNLYINDSLVCHGPVNIGGDYFDKTPPAYWYFSSYDVKPYLRQGENVIAAEVYSWAFELSEVTSTNGRFLCDLSLDGDKPEIFTDHSWKCALDTCYSTDNERLVFNANNEPARWKKINFNDQHWAEASEKAPVNSAMLFQNDIPSVINVPISPQKISVLYRSHWEDVTNENFFGKIEVDREFLLDFGKNMSARINFSLMANVDDSLVIMPFEKLNYEPNRSFRYVCRNGVNNFLTPNLHVFRFLKVKVYTKSSVKINSFQADFSSYPVQYRGDFSCSDTLYNQVWDIIRWTTQLCMNDMFFDSPKHQEPIACTGDYLIESLSNYYAFGDPWLVRQNLIQTARMLEKNDYQMFHTSYSLLWVQMMKQYFQYTGDTLLIKQMMPYVHNLLSKFETYQGSNFLLSNSPNYMFMDWINIHEFNAHHPPAVIGMGYLTAFYYKALIDAAYLDECTGAASKSQDYLKIADNIKIGFNKELWDADKGLYKDGIPFITDVQPNKWLPADKEIVTYSPHVNTLAVLYDIAPRDRQNALMKYVVEQEEYELQPYFMSYVLAALKHTENIEEGLRQIDLWKNAIDLTTHTLKENWQDVTVSGYGGDYSHAWGGSPLYFLSQNILGISQEEPGFKMIRVNPYVGDQITWAKGKVPVFDGSVISVSWKRLPGHYIYSITIPENSTAVLVHPERFRNATVCINSKIVHKTSGNLILSSGNYVIEYTE